MIKKGVYLVMFLFLITLVTAQPTYVTINPSGLTVITPVSTYLKAGQDYDVHVHVYNATGVLMTDTHVDYCNIHLYNSSGNHIIQDNMTFSSNSFDWEYTISGSLLTIGEYQTIVTCQDSIGGFGINEFFVTKDGEDPYQYPYAWIPFILAVGFIAFLWLYLSFNINGIEQKLFFVKLLSFVNAIINIVLLGFFTYLIVLNPSRIDLSISVVAAYFSINVLLSALFVWVYGFHAVLRSLKFVKDHAKIKNN
jgi:hypothetical protein